VILVVAAQRMRSDGIEFFVTPNGVWLTDNVPVEYIHFPE
jgi:putative RNA 2'-phosphotransferase